MGELEWVGWKLLFKFVFFLVILLRILDLLLGWLGVVKFILVGDKCFEFGFFLVGGRYGLLGGDFENKGGFNEVNFLCVEFCWLLFSVNGK